MNSSPRTWIWAAGAFCALAGWLRCQAQVVRAGDILIANYNASSVVKIDPATGAQERLGGTFSVPTDLVMDANGNLYISEWGGAIKRMELPSGTVTTVTPSGSGPSQVWGIALGPTGELFVTSRGDHAVYRVNPATGTPVLVTRGDQLYTPVGIDFLDANHLVVACLLTNRLVSVSLLDNSQSVIMEGGGLDQPWGVAVSDAGVYVAGYDRKDIQMVTGGTLTTIATMGDFPYAMAVDGAGNPVVGLKGAGESVARLGPDGTVLRTYTGSLIRWVTGIEVARYSVFVPAAITTGPQSQKVTQGGDTTFAVVATGTPPLTYQWYFNQTEAIPWGTTETLSLTNVQPANAGSYSVVVSNGSSVASSNAWLTVNRLPVPTAPVLERAAPLGAKLRVANFLGTDPDGDPVSLTAAGPTSAHGGTVQVTRGWVAYTPPAGLVTSDSFSFAVSDGQGGFATGTASVVVPTDDHSTENLIAEPAGGNAARLRGDGIPGRSYALEYSESLEFPHWQRLAVRMADSSGSFLYVDTPAADAPPRFYRAVEP